MRSVIDLTYSPSLPAAGVFYLSLGAKLGRTLACSMLLILYSYLA